MSFFKRFKRWIKKKIVRKSLKKIEKKEVQQVQEIKYFVRGDISKELKELWDNLEIKTLGRQKESDINWYISKINQNKDKYISAAHYVKKESGKSVPWEVLAVLHAMEGSLNISKQILNGENWKRKTKLVPKGYGPFSSFENSCLVGLSLKQLPLRWNIESTLYFMEKWNGLGYRTKGKRSPYLWSYSNHQERGKFVRDHVYDENAVSLQVGCAILLKELNYLNNAE